VLVLDRSGSMQGQKLSDASQAASAFIGLIDLTHNQAGIVTFAADARLDQPLGQDAGALDAALGQIQTSSGTNIASGIISATNELMSSRRSARAIPVMILLSDGNSNMGDAEDASARTKAQGIRIITIGLGEDASADLLVRLASAPGDYHFA